MDKDTIITKRKSMHLSHYDYSQVGFYFITICTHNRLNLFGNIKNDLMQLNEAGKMIQEHWLELSNSYNNIKLHEYIVMPNHFHAIIEISKTHKSLIEIIAAYKSQTTNQYIKGVNEKDWKRFDRKLWQRNFYDHVIRDSESFEKITEYIIYNPAKWYDDKYYSES